MEFPSEVVASYNPLVPNPFPRSRSLTRNIAILAIVATVPFSGMAPAAVLRGCDSQAAANAVAHQGAACCGEHQAPCDYQGKACPSTARGCASGSGHVQAIDRAYLRLTAEPSHLLARAPVAPLISAAGPDGQWRPPRSL